MAGKLQVTPLLVVRGMDSASLVYHSSDYVAEIVPSLKESGATVYAVVIGSNRTARLELL